MKPNCHKYVKRVSVARPLSVTDQKFHILGFRDLRYITLHFLFSYWWKPSGRVLSDIKILLTFGYYLPLSYLKYAIAKSKL